jgi:uncharacterized repeat protein (TIGR01451 family)
MLSTRILRGSFIAAFLTLAGLSAAQAATVTLRLVAARNEPLLATGAVCATSATQVCKGQAIPNFKYIINIDNTGTTEQRSPDLGTGCNPGDTGVDATGKAIRYPDTCHWTSIAGAASHSPVYAQGDQADFNAGGVFSLSVPDGRYLISVLADGYKLDGRHFTVKGGVVTWAGDGAAGIVPLQPNTLPDAQIQAEVFEDVSPVNSAPDVPAEHGLAGFQGHILDVLGEVTTNVYGDPLCTTYNADGSIALVGGRCLSKCYVVDGGVDVGTVAPVDAAGRCPLDPTLPNGNGRPMLENGTPAPTTAAIEGKVKIPNLGTNRYTLSVTPPDGSGWIQTTTLEGNHDWDAWVMEGATGLDTEFIVAGEPFPAIIFGYVPTVGTPSGAPGPNAPSLEFTDTSAAGKITGVIERVKIYVPTTGGVPGLPGSIWGGLQGAKIDQPEDEAWVTLSDLNNGDTIVYAKKANTDGTFTISNVPDGSYTLTWWDEPQNQILDLVNVTVVNGETVDMGILPLSGWWTVIDGYVFNDTNRNGVREAGEPGLAGYTLTMRRRENSLMDRGSTVISTDANGYYKFESAYPMTQFLVEEAYDDGHYTTGITYQADNQPTPTTILGAGVDVSVHPIIGLSGTLDWGKHTYDAAGRNGIDPQNGGIVGTVTYDTTRNELDPRYAAVEDWQPSVSDLVVKLYRPVPVANPATCVRLLVDGSNSALGAGTPKATCDSTGRYALADDGSIAKGPLLNTYLTETWQRPTGCTVRDIDGNPVVHGDPVTNPAGEQFLPTDTTSGCIESPITGVQFAPYDTDQGTPDANFGAAVDGNYGFGDACTGTLDATDPSAPVCTGGVFAPLSSGDYLVQVDLGSQLDAFGRPVYKVTREDDINIGNGDNFVPAVPPPACAGPLHTVNATNPTFLDIGGSPYEGQQKPLCDTKLVSLANGKSIAPAFNVFTDVPLPGRHWFIIIDDLNFSSNPKSVTYGEKAGMPFVPVGIYDFTDRLVTTVESDYNGLADVLLPSTNRIACPTPSGVCTNLYRYVGNDPGVPGRLNLNFNPNFRTIAAEFEVMPGSLIPADLAPTQVGVTVQLPGGQVTSPVQCLLDAATPQLYRVNTPFIVRPANGTNSFTITGVGFGANKGAGNVTLDGVALNTNSWSDTQIVAQVGTGAALGPHQLRITAANGQSTVNGLTFHVVSTAAGSTYNPQIYQVGPGLTGPLTYVPREQLPAAADHAIQAALNAAAAYVGTGPNANRPALVVVYPNNPSADPRQNPRGAYYENLIISANVKLQGVGPGSPNGAVRGSIIDGGAFAGDSPVATDWYATLGNLTWSGNQTVYDGAVISLFLPNTGNRAFPATYAANSAPSIDGFDLRGGDQQGFPGNINVGGAVLEPGIAGTGPLTTQGGAVFANGYARNLQITNNVVQNNGGAYGTIRIGTPDLPASTPNHNENVVIAYNRVVNNAGTNLAGGIGLFNGSDAYQVKGNDICGNFSAEYGGGISALGYSPGGTISANRVYFNRSYDEGGGIMIAGSLPAQATSLSPGSGSVDIFGNLIQANLSNDDGGGIRFLMAGNFPMNVYNNFIVNNISTHEGGGIALNDAPNVRVYNNTIMKNLTTATAITSNGAAAPAGLSTSYNSAALQATLGNGASTFSNPLLFNNIFWDNRAGTRAGTGVTGLGVADAVHWDVGSADSAAILLTPTNSVVQQSAATFPYTTSPTNSAVDPAVAVAYDIGVTFNAWRNNPAFLGAIMISADLPPNRMGNYHINVGSSAANLGASTKGAVAAPGLDIDGDTRPANGGYDAGADEVAGPSTANLSITKTDGVTSVQAGQQVTYTITVSNAGPATVNGATVNDPLPANLGSANWTCAPASSCAAASGTGSISAVNVTLLSGASVTFRVTGTVLPGATSLVNTATVAVPTGVTDPNLGNNTATDTDTVTTPVDLAITKTDGLTTVGRGSLVRYTIVVSNLGAYAATGAQVADTFPTTNNRLTGPIAWTCTVTGGATCGGAVTGTGNIGRTVNLPAGSTITFTTTSGNLSATATATTLVNTATVGVPAGYVDTNTANNSATDTDTVVPTVGHVGPFTATSVNTGGNNGTTWTATVTVTVHDASHNPVVGASVTGNWAVTGNGSGNGSGNCTTGSAGTCTVTRTGINRTSRPTLTYTVTALGGAVANYNAAANHGPGNSIVVSRPGLAGIAAARLLPATVQPVSGLRSRVAPARRVGQ